MTLAFLIALVCAFVVAWCATLVVSRVALRVGALDTGGVSGQVKAERRAVPNVGGIGIVVGIVMPLVAAAIAAWFGLIPDAILPTELAGGVGREWVSGLAALLGLLLVHAMGLLDDRRPLAWLPKLGMMLLVPAGVAWFGDTRVLTALDSAVGGAWLSVLITAVWFAIVMNAVNFMDNMDGLAGGTAAVIAAATCGVASLQGQWLVAGSGAVIAGASLGFLVHNYPRARIFMGDGGSLVLGFCLAYLTARLTYIDADTESPRWDRLLIPFVLLSVPLYDMLSVVLIRLSQGKSPFVGDLQHLSHRFERRGLSRPRVAASVWALASITGLGAVLMARAEPWQAVLLLVQTMMTLVLLALVERGLRDRGTGA